jgi:hypothetical protein
MQQPSSTVQETYGLLLRRTRWEKCHYPRLLSLFHSPARLQSGQRVKVIPYENSSELFQTSFGISRRSGIIILSGRPATLREETIGRYGYISRVTAIRYPRHHANESLLI